jgi:hypothetical protein
VQVESFLVGLECILICQDEVVDATFNVVMVMAEQDLTCIWDLDISDTPTVFSPGMVNVVESIGIIW